jgi:predicted dehydrogenase
MTEAPLGVAMIGLGRWGNTIAEQVLKTPGMHLVTCYTRTPAKREAFSQRFRCGQEPSYEAALQHTDVEAVVITAPNNMHAELTVAAAEHGKHVFVDKPISTLISDAKKMIEACEKAGVVLAVGASSRRLRGHRVCKRLLEEGALGVVALAETNYSNDRGLHYTPENWQWYATGSPGGPLMQVAIHQLDNFYYLFGPVRRVSASFRKVITKSEIPDAAALWLEFESGLLGTLGTSFISPLSPKGRYTYFLNAYGSEANFYHDRWDGIFLFRKGREERERVPYEEYKGFDYLGEELADFQKAVRGGRPPEVSGADGLHVLAVVQAALRSAEIGRPVELAEILEG